MMYKKYISVYFSLKKTIWVLGGVIVALFLTLLCYFFLVIYIVNNKPIVVLSNYVPSSFITRSGHVSKIVLEQYGKFLSMLLLNYKNYEEYLANVDLFTTYLNPHFAKFFIEDARKNAELIKDHEISQVFLIKRIDINQREKKVYIEGEKMIFVKGMYRTTEKEELLLTFYISQSDNSFLLETIKRVQGNPLTNKE